MKDIVRKASFFSCKYHGHVSPTCGLCEVQRSTHVFITAGPCLTFLNIRRVLMSLDSGTCFNSFLYAVWSCVSE